MALYELSDVELDQEISDRIIERERRALLKRSEVEHARIIEAYAEAIAVEPARPIDDIPASEAVGPGGRILDKGGTEWVNQSRAWLSPHTAGPKDYPMGWRSAVPPDPGTAPSWKAGETVKPGDLRAHGGVTYRCIQGHTTAAGWEPPNVPALWAVA